MADRTEQKGSRFPWWKSRVVIAAIIGAIITGLFRLISASN